MASNKFFTIMVVPEKTQQVRKIVIPHYIFNGAILALVFIGVLAAIMILDYANVMNQISENKQLRIENRQLKQSIQVFKNKMLTMENTVDRVKTFVTKLRIITNIENRATPLVPAGANPIGGTGFPAAMPPLTPASPASGGGAEIPGPNPASEKKSPESSSVIERDTDEEMTQADPATKPSVLDPQAIPIQGQGYDSDSDRIKRRTLLAALMTQNQDYGLTLNDADSSLFVKTEFEKLDAAYEEVNKFSVAMEQEAQDLLERLGEKRVLLASTPTLIPTLGYITSEYGVRISPYDGRRKMHEGIDIANRYGADIVAPADGTVVFAGVKPGYGKIVILDHGNGIETSYAHNAKSFVAAGEHVRRGQRIAAVGSSGHSTGPHCHYEVHAGGLPVDPCWYILDHPSLCSDR